MTLPDRLGDGRPFPSGATVTSDGINFALYSASADAVDLCLYDATGTEEIARLPLPSRTDNVWHGFLPDGRAGQRYGYRVHGAYAPPRGLRFNAAKLLLDPYARRWDRPLLWADPTQGHQIGAADQEPVFDPRDNGATMAKAIATGADAFDWDGDRRPATPLDRTVVYELHVKGFTRLHDAIPETLRGRYGGLAHDAAIAHLLRLGVTAVELLPVMAFVDEPFARIRGLTNYWGYNTLGFFQPDSRYAVTDPVAEFKALVKALHAAGLEVILDVVANHTGEGDHAGPTLSFRGIDNPGYYRLDPDRLDRYQNQTGTGNVLDLSRPAALRMVMDSLRWWAGEFHIDGFRFDLATVLARNGSGDFQRDGGFLAAVAQDPALQGLKLIAEPWDIGSGGYQVGAFPPGWSEWNDRSRIDLRRSLLRRDLGVAGLADLLAGSSREFCHDGRMATSSVNYVTAHDGFTLEDLVSYETKRNLANGEDNRDGADDNDNWNCGAEGPTADTQVLERRSRIKRALLATLFACRGMPMLAMGDELGRSQDGNNNSWCQDNEIAWLDWRTADQALIHFTAELAALRRNEALLHAGTWLADESVRWLQPDGSAIAGDRWQDPAIPALGMHLLGATRQILVLINRSLEPLTFGLPGAGWELLLDSVPEIQGTLTAFSTDLTGLSVQFWGRHLLA